MSFSDDERITLDRNTFKALASETRVDILKKLEGTQKTVSELARELNMNKATMYQHLEQLRTVGLVKRLDGAERNTTVKMDPLEEPTVGPPRKWVYYKLTFKGKNVVNPGKVKFAVMLAVVGIIAVAILAIFMANLALNAPGGGSAPTDKIAPEITTWITPDLSTKTTDCDFSVEIYDSPYGKKISGLNEDNVTMSYGIGDSDTSGPTVVGWTPLTVTHTSGVRYGARISGIDWSKMGGNYVYLKVDAWDRAGNKNSTGRLLYIVTFKEADLTFGPLGVTLGGGAGSGADYIVNGQIVNQNNMSTGAFSVGVYSVNPDPDGDGIVDNYASLSRYTLCTIQISSMDAYAEKNISQTITNAQLRVVYPSPDGDHKLYVFIDPTNKIKEEQRDNNMMSFTPPPSMTAVLEKNGKGPLAKESGAPGFEVIGVFGAMAAVVLIKARKTKKE
jgi:DNA-binding transcriptional ArsR family regulator